MKLRILGNSIRIRLTRPEVEALAGAGHVEETTELGATEHLIYRVE